jgi:hypothetical protein
MAQAPGSQGSIPTQRSTRRMQARSRPKTPCWPRQLHPRKHGRGGIPRRRRLMKPGVDALGTRIHAIITGQVD